MRDRAVDRVWSNIDPQIRAYLETRLGAKFARQRLGIERDHEAQVFGQGLNFFHFENLTALPTLIRTVLKVSGAYRPGQRNAANVEIRHNIVESRLAPASFDGFKLLHLSDLHADISELAMARVCELLRDLTYDVCVLTGDYRGETGFWAFNNLHRFALYAITLQMAFLWYDVLAQFAYRGSFHLGLGSLVMLVNVVCLTGYTFGCHALRHLVGGSRDCLSCSRVRLQLWRGVTVLNVRHDRWAWVSLFSVLGTDIYIRLLILGVLPHANWV